MAAAILLVAGATALLLVPRLHQPAMSWTTVVDDWPGTLLAVDGRADDDVWIVGAAVGGRATVLRLSDRGWRQVDVGIDADLWAVEVLDDGSVLVAGSGGRLLRLHGDDVDHIGPNTPIRHSLTDLTTTGSTIWAVGGTGTRAGVLWRSDETGWRQLRLPGDLTLTSEGGVPALVAVDALSTDVVALTTEGDLLRATPHHHEVERIGAGPPGAGVLADDGRIVTVGPTGPDRAPGSVDGLDLLATTGYGIASDDRGQLWVVGQEGTVHALRGSQQLDRPQAGSSDPVTDTTLRSVWVAPSGAVWAVGGNLGDGLDRGVVVRGQAGETAPIPPLDLDPRADLVPAAPTTCPPPTDGSRRSVTRVLNELALWCVRHDEPNPLTTARNLFHLHVALYDAWIATTSPASGSPIAASVPSVAGVDRDRVLAAAGVEILRHRYGSGPAAADLEVCLGESLAGLLPDLPGGGGRTTDPEADLGRAIAHQVLTWASRDGYTTLSDTSTSEQPPLVVGHSGTQATDPLVWQPLDTSRRIPLTDAARVAGLQRQLGPHWGDLRRFALPELPLMELVPELDGPPRTLDDAYVDEIVELVLASWAVGVDAGDAVPVGLPEAANVVLPTGGDASPHPGDVARTIAEYWEGGRGTETPPGHWNLIAHGVADHPELSSAWLGREVAEDRLAWDTLTLLTLNAALHDAAIVAWDAKRYGSSSRPITLIRWMGAQGQRSDPTSASYHPDGLPLIDGVIEVITDRSSAPGGPHEHLHHHVGEIALRSWPGAPGDPSRSRSPATWIRAVDWLPYQADDFVTPPFPGWVSGHSTFSAAAAVVLADITGTDRFPGGQHCHRVPAATGLVFEHGPSQDVDLCWSTFGDAAEQAGLSRIYGGIHPAVDHRDGARLGTAAGHAALDRVAGLLTEQDP